MLKELILKNRSYRGFNESRAVTQEELTELVDCARLTASTANTQPLKFCIAWKKEDTAKILSLTKWAGALPELHLPRPGTAPTGFIIILQDTSISANTAPFQKDCGIAAQTILLRATEMGLGGCMIGNFNPNALREALELPKNLLPLLTVAVGEPAETIVLTEAVPGESTRYYRDSEDVHYVPKRALTDILVLPK